MKQSTPRAANGTMDATVSTLASKLPFARARPLPVAALALAAMLLLAWACQRRDYWTIYSEASESFEAGVKIDYVVESSTSLADAIDQLNASAGTDVRIDAESIRTLPNTTVAGLRLKGVRAAKVLRLLLDNTTSSEPLTYIVDRQGHILVMTDSGIPLHHVRFTYSMRDFVDLTSISSDGPTADDIMLQMLQILTNTVRPDLWRDPDRGASASIEGSSIVIVADIPTQLEVRRLLEQFRETRASLWRPDCFR